MEVMEEISNEQLKFLAKKMRSLPYDKILIQSYQDSPDVILAVQGQFDNETFVKFAYHRRDREIVVLVKTGKSGLERRINIPRRAFGLGELLSKAYWQWVSVKSYAEGKKKAEKDKIKNTRVEEVSRIIDMAFPNEIEKQLFGDK
jgi:hypothetical protein